MALALLLSLVATLGVSGVGAQSPTAAATPAATSTVTPGVSAAASPLATLPAGSSVEVLATWGSVETDSFQAMVAPWEQQTGAKMNFTGTRDLIAILTTRIQAGNPPDIAILPNPGQMIQLANANNLKPLSTMLDMATINQQYSTSWVDLGTVNGTLYAIFMKAANKSMIWYNPNTFTTNGWQIPGTWDELISLSDKIVSDKKTPAYPWSVGVESGQASGWPATDWIAQIFLTKYGGDVYDQWVNHQIPWTDPRIKDAWNMFGTIINTPGYVPGGATTALSTNFQDATYLPFQTPPQAAMHYEGDFVEGFITAQFPNLVAGKDFDFFPFPTIVSATGTAGSPAASSTVTASPNASASVLASPPATAAATAAYPSGTASPVATVASQAAVTGGADLVCAFKDNAAVRSFVSYLATPEAQTIWVKRGGFTSLNKLVSLDAYPDAIAKKSAQQLVSASLFRFGAGDMMPSAMQAAWWAGVLQYLQNPDQLDSILINLENTAKTAYATTATAGSSATASATATVSPTSMVSSTATSP